MHALKFGACPYPFEVWHHGWMISSQIGALSNRFIACFQAMLNR